MVQTCKRNLFRSKVATPRVAESDASRQPNRAAKTPETYIPTGAPWSRQPNCVIDAPKTHVPTGAPWTQNDAASGHQLAPDTDAAQTSATSLRQMSAVSEAPEIPAWIFNGSDEIPYTTDQSRLVLTTPEKAECMALLPNRELSEKLTAAILKNRELNAAADETDQELFRLDCTVRSLERETKEVELQVVQLGEAPTSEAQETLATLNQSLEGLRRQQAKAEQQRKDVRSGLDTEYRAQNYNVHVLLTALDEVFTESKVLAPEFGGDSEPRGDEGGDTGASQGSQAPATSDAEVGPQTTAEGASGNLSKEAEEDLKWNLIGAFRSASNQVYFLQRAFEDREKHFDLQAEERARKLEAGEAVESPRDFDLRQLKETHEMTRELIEAEKEMDKAKAAAFAAGVPIPGSDIESGFVDDVDDGYRLSSEQEVAASVDPAFICAWMQGVPEEDTGAQEPAEADEDEWDAEPMGLSDSASMIADGPPRRRIDKWRAMCESIRALTLV